MTYKEIIKLGQICIKKNYLHSSKEPINVVVVSVDLILRYVFSGFAGYEDQFHDEIKYLLIKTPKLNRSIKSLEKDSNTLNKYSETRNTIAGVTRKDVDVDTIHKNKYYIFQL